MVTWGISAASHNAALSVFHNGRLTFASDSERFSRVKNDPNLNNDLIEYALAYGEPTEIVWYEKPFLKSLRQMSAGQGWIDNNVRRYLNKYDIATPLISTVSHHRSHAAGGYYTSNFTNAAVVVIDAIGEYDTTSIWNAEGEYLTKVWDMKYPHSIGLFYSAMTQRIGLKPNEEEYILMGMAAYGDLHRFFDEIYEHFVIETKHGFKFKGNLHKGCMDWRPDLTTEQDMFDIAAGTQAVYEALFIKILEKAKKLVPFNNLVLTGGCALNCMANPIAAEFYDNIWIMPAPGDNGSAIGAVLAKENKHIDWPGPLLGYDMGYSATNREIVDHLLKHKMCGIARGKAEFGPRALGNRSLLADPRGPEIKALINTIKKRQQFRPFSPSIMAEFANSHFKMPVKSTPYMQYIAECKKYGSYPAIVHHDKTSRVQTVTVQDNRQYYDLLQLWHQKTGCPMLLNTSLNIKGEPIVNTEADATAWMNKYNVKIFN